MCFGGGGSSVDYGAVQQAAAAEATRVAVEKERAKANAEILSMQGKQQTALEEAAKAQRRDQLLGIYGSGEESSLKVINPDDPESEKQKKKTLLGA